jgi:hypothetical protein
MIPHNNKKLNLGRSAQAVSDVAMSYWAFPPSKANKHEPSSGKQQQHKRSIIPRTIGNDSV